MKKKPTSNKAEKYNEENYLKQKDHKDKERREHITAIYKDHPLPLSRKPTQKRK